MLTGRWYQNEAHDATFNFLDNTETGNPIVAMPTGTGKSVNIARAATHVVQRWPSMRVMMLTTSKNLIVQNLEKLRWVWPQAPVGVYSAGLKAKNADMPITYAGMQSAKNNPKKFGKQHLILVDEAQLVSDEEESGYIKLLNAMREENPKLRVIGYSASPYRMGMGMLTEGNVFTDVCYDITGRDAFNRLIDEAFLCPLIPFPTETELDIKGVRRSGGDLNQKQLQEAVNVESITRAALQEALEKAWDRQHWLIFATGVKHAENIAGMLQMWGFSAAAVHSKLDPKVVDQRIKEFRAGRIRMLVNADMLTTGFDYPEIDCIIMLRPTVSTGLWVQMLGRGTRPVYAPGFYLEDLEQRLMAFRLGGKPNCLVLDFAGNISKLGPINDPRIPKMRGEGTGEVPIKICEKDRINPLHTACGAWNHAAARFCTNCRAEFTFAPKILEKASTAQLIIRDEPQIVVFDVDRVVYQLWTKEGSPDSIQVQYYCGLRRFHEWVCLEHEGYASKAARDWWRVRFNLPPGSETPPTTKAAEKWIHLARTPVQIKVHVNQRNPRITDHIFKEQSIELRNRVPPPGTTSDHYAERRTFRLT